VGTTRARVEQVLHHHSAQLVPADHLVDDPACGLDDLEWLFLRAATYSAVLEELAPAAWHRTDQDANNRVEADHGRLKARLRPMRGRKQDRSATVIIKGHACMQNVRGGRDELAIEAPIGLRVAVAFGELAAAI
jgi:hypothetical protein